MPWYMTAQKARKEYICEGCNKVIYKGEKYVRYYGIPQRGTWKYMKYAGSDNYCVRCGILKAERLGEIHKNELISSGVAGKTQKRKGKDLIEEAWELGIEFALITTE